MPFRAHWPPVDQLLKLGGITLLLKIIAFAYEWNYSGRYIISVFYKLLFLHLVYLL